MYSALLLKKVQVLYKTSVGLDMMTYTVRRYKFVHHQILSCCLFPMLWYVWVYMAIGHVNELEAGLIYGNGSMLSQNNIIISNL